MPAVLRTFLTAASVISAGAQACAVADSSHNSTVKFGNTHAVYIPARGWMMPSPPTTHDLSYKNPWIYTADHGILIELLLLKQHTSRPTSTKQSTKLTPTSERQSKPSTKIFSQYVTQQWKLVRRPLQQLQDHEHGLWTQVQGMTWF